MSEQRLVFVRRASGLVRELTATDVVIWSIAAPTASGLLYYQVTTAGEYPGASPLLSFLIGGIILLPLVLTVAAMMRIMPRSGGMYVAISRLVDPSVGYVTGAVYAVNQGLSAGVMAWVGTSVLASVLSLGGHAGRVPGLVAAGEWMAGTTGHTITAVALTVLFWLVCLVSMRAVKVLMRLSFFLPLAATVVLAFFGAVTVDPVAAFDRTWGAGVFQKVLDAARAQGWQPPAFSWASTIGMLLVVFWAYQSFEFASAVAGEVKNPQRSLFSGITGGYLGTVLLYMAVSWCAWHPFARSHFINAYVFLYDNHPDILQSIMPLSRPSVPLFLGSLIPNPWAAIVVMLLMCLWFYNTALPGIVVGARFIFAMSFDRQLPKVFSRVNRRGVPDVATHSMMIFGILAILLNVYGVQAVLAMLDVTGYFPFWAFGMAALMLPYKRPDIYMLSPMQGEFLGIPIISWLGGLGTAIGWFLVAFAVAPLGTGPQVMFCLTVFVLTVLYMWNQQRNIKEGVDVTAIFSEIPPE